MSIIDRPIRPIPKPGKKKKVRPYVSKKIRQSAKGEACTLRIPGICNNNPETVVLCRVNSAKKGMGNKSLDIHSYYGCASCHRIETANKADPKDILRAMCETQYKLLQKGLIETK